MRAGAICGAFLVFSSVTSPASAQTADPADPYIWLEDVHGEKALAWAKQENDRTLGELQGDARYKPMYDQAMWDKYQPDNVSLSRDRL